MSYVLTGPDHGEVGRMAMFKIALGPAVHPTGVVRFTPSVSSGDGTLSPAAFDLSETARSGSFSYTPGRSGARTIAITNNGGLTDPIPISFNSKVHTSSSYFISPKSTSGTGTKSNPFGLPDLLNTTTSPVTQGPALKILRSGDTLYFLAGTYHISGGKGGGFTACPMICPTVPGTPSEPITLAAYPGATVDIVCGGGNQAIFGTGPNYVRFLGFSVDPGPGAFVNSENVGPAAFYVTGTGNEVGYCTIIGRYIATGDNHAGIRFDFANSAWVHHNIIYGVEGDGTNSAGIEVYASTQIIVEDNYIHDCMVGILDKDAGKKDGANQPTYRRNYVTNCRRNPFVGNNQGAQALFYIYDNVFDGTVNLNGLNNSSQIHNNLVRATTGPFSGRGKVWNMEFWNNIMLAGGRPIMGYRDNDVPFVRGGPLAPLAYMDHNVYDGATTYDFGGYTAHHTILNFQQMGRQGFEQHSRVVRGASVIFQDLTSYQLRPPWRTAGRDRDPVGPRFPIAGILDTGRYGPRAFLTGSRPIINQQPHSQKAAVGERATFSVQVNGSGPLYQWQRSNDGGKTWITIQGANLPVFTIPHVSTTDGGAIVRCLVSSVGGSVWSDTATMTVSAAAAPFS
jgi:hypothetical protein